MCLYKVTCGSVEISEALTKRENKNRCPPCHEVVSHSRRFEHTLSTPAPVSLSQQVRAGYPGRDEGLDVASPKQSLYLRERERHLSLPISLKGRNVIQG